MSRARAGGRVVSRRSFVLNCSDAFRFAPPYAEGRTDDVMLCAGATDKPRPRNGGTSAGNALVPRSLIPHTHSLPSYEPHTRTIACTCHAFTLPRSRACVRPRPSQCCLARIVSKLLAAVLRNSVGLAAKNAEQYCRSCHVRAPVRACDKARQRRTKPGLAPPGILACVCLCRGAFRPPTKTCRS